MKQTNYYIQRLIFEFKRYIKYRANIVFGFFNDLLVPIMINILFVIAVNNASTDKMEIMQLIFYILWANVIYAISMTSIENIMSGDIRTSKLGYKLVAPVNPAVDYIISDISAKISHFALLFLPLFVISLFFFRIGSKTYLCGLLSLLLATGLGYTISFIIGCFSFWMTEIWGVGAIKMLLLSVLAGTVFPLSFLPDGVYKMVMYSPFPYISYFPSAIWVEEISLGDIPHHFLVGLLWLLFFFIASILIWKKGIKKYECMGV